MKFSHFFIDRPIFASVLSILIVLVGGITYFALPVSQYPEIAPPTISVTASYPGATPETIAETVATPIEQEMNGVDNMLYMESSSGADGTMQLTVTFALGTDLDDAQVLVQNRVAIAEARLPEQVRQIGITTRKRSPNFLMVVHLISPDSSRDQLYISNYAYLRVRDVLARLDGVGDISISGGSEYSMRIWLDIEKMAILDLTPGDAVAAIRQQNVQVAAGSIGQPPNEQQGAFQISVNTQGRLREPDEFRNIIVKRTSDGQVVRVRDVARVELGAQNYAQNSYLNGQPAIALMLFQRPGSNAVDTAADIKAAMDDLRTEFPEGVDYRIAYNPTDFVEESIDEVFTTLLISAALVVLTVFLFLQGWRATIVPVVAIPISLIGTFALMQVLGLSLNSLSLFGLVLAIGIVVDDAIVVVENVERLIAEGLSPKEATHRAMTEVSSALIATTLVLIAVFVPTAFVSGISGQFYRQFALTIAISTAISTFVSLTLSPALCGILLKPKDAKPHWFDRILNLLFGWLFRLFNKAFDWGSNIYSRVVSKILRLSAIALLLYAGLIGLTGYGFQVVPTGFIPPQDQGYIIVSMQLPDGASLARTDDATQRASEILSKTPGIRDVVAISGFSGATFAAAPNVAAMFVILEDSRERSKKGLGIAPIMGQMQQRLLAIQEAQVFVIPPPPVRGIGTGGGFKMYVQDRGDAGVPALNQATTEMVIGANQQPEIAMAYTNFRGAVPRVWTEIDRTKAQKLNLSMNSVFEVMQVYLGSLYVNDFNYLGRTYRVTVQAESDFRNEATDILRLRTRSGNGAVVPLGSIARVERSAGPDRLVRFNMYPAADISGSALPGVSTGQTLNTMEQLAESTLPNGFSYEWTDLSRQQKMAGNTAIYLFPLAVLFAFLALSAQYESWSLPLAVILIVPLCILFALTGIWMRQMDNNILTQIGFIVLVGLACKNAILIVEFAKQEEDSGKNRFDAAIEACRLRLRPILMTAISFILGVFPLLIATGAGFEMRRVLGTAVFSGMVGVTFVGLFLTPVFYVVIRRFAAQSDSALQLHPSVTPSSLGPANADERDAIVVSGNDEPEESSNKLTETSNEESAPEVTTSVEYDLSPDKTSCNPNIETEKDEEEGNSE